VRRPPLQQLEDRAVLGEAIYDERGDTSAPFALPRAS